MEYITRHSLSRLLVLDSSSRLWSSFFATGKQRESFVKSLPTTNRIHWPVTGITSKMLLSWVRSSLSFLSFLFSLSLSLLSPLCLSSSLSLSLFSLLSVFPLLSLSLSSLSSIFPRVRQNLNDLVFGTHFVTDDNSDQSGLLPRLDTDRSSLFLDSFRRSDNCTAFHEGITNTVCKDSSVTGSSYLLLFQH